jgi:hypothetical protein
VIATFSIPDISGQYHFNSIDQAPVESGIRRIDDCPLAHQQPALREQRGDFIENRADHSDFAETLKK